MLKSIRSFPEQLTFTPEIIGKVEKFKEKTVVVGGMGGSGAVGDFLADWLGNVVMVKEYKLPGFVDKESFVLLVSYSGNTEETLSLMHECMSTGARCIVVCSGGKLEEVSKDIGFPVFKVPGGYQPREAYGYLLKASVLALYKTGFITEEQFDDFEKSCRRLVSYLSELDNENTITYEVSSKIYRRLPIIYSSFPSVAIRWKNQLNENAKNFAHISTFPEHNHNEIEGFDHPEFIKDKAWLIFLRSDYEHPRVSMRMDIVKDILKDSIVGYSEVRAKGKTKVEQILYLIWFGDFVSYWLAVQNAVDPYRIDRITLLKKTLQP